MRVSTLMYHDVDDPHGRPSGFSGGGPDRYTVSPERFREHVDRIATATAGPPAGAEQVTAGQAPPGSWMLTFDDGGSSGIDVGEALARRSWRGHFFLTTDLVGRPGFLDWDQVRELARLGHVIGSHSRTHPTRMADCSWERLLDEWSTSAAVLSDELSGPVSTASVPGGLYSHEVGRAAARTGFSSLFTSLPTRHVGSVDGCLVIGRYAIRRDTSATQAAGAAAGRPLVWTRQQAAWRLRGAARRVGGQRYERMRRALLRRS